MALKGLGDRLVLCTDLGLSLDIVVESDEIKATLAIPYLEWRSGRRCCSLFLRYHAGVLLRQRLPAY